MPSYEDNLFLRKLRQAGISRAAAEALLAHIGTDPNAGTHTGFVRNIAPDPTSGSFDYAADLVGPPSSLFGLDDSEAWVADWGYPVPVVTGDGVYTVIFGATSSVPWRAQLAFKNDDVGDTMFGSNWTNTVGTLFHDEYDSSVQVTLFLPANTHIDVAFESDPDPNGFVIAMAIMKIS